MIDSKYGQTKEEACQQGHQDFNHLRPPKKERLFDRIQKKEKCKAIGSQATDGTRTQRGNQESQVSAKGGFCASHAMEVLNGSLLSTDSRLHNNFNTHSLHAGKRRRPTW